jgi:hypothetical protein
MLRPLYTRYPLDRRLGGPKVGLDTALWWKEINLPCRELNHGRPVCTLGTTIWALSSSAITKGKEFQRTRSTLLTEHRPMEDALRCLLNMDLLIFNIFKRTQFFMVLLHIFGSGEQNIHILNSSIELGGRGDVQPLYPCLFRKWSSEMNSAKNRS